MTKKLVEKYGKFHFEGYNYSYYANKEELEIQMHYSFDREEAFQEKLTLKVAPESWEKVNLKALDRALDGLFLIAGISYYKAYCPRVMVQNIVPMNDEQAAFWNKLYERGLGEFFYQNKLDFRGLINFKANDLEANVVEDIQLTSRALLPLGGGKDSIVSAEILKKSGLDFQTFSLRDAEPIRQTAEVIGRSRIVVGRQLDPRLIMLNESGVLNGHVPITAYISFLLVVCAVIYDYKYLILSLEKSANFGQLEFYGMDINHQYSKSEEFEGDFRNYVTKYVAPGIEYFSLLRGYFELKIVDIFSGLKNLDEYLPIFTSCNANFKIVKEKSATKWCGHCPKCAFVFLCMAPFISREKLVETFGINMLDQDNLWELFEELVGVKNFKPFECVGTAEECRAAIWKISQSKVWQNDKIVKKMQEEYLPKWGDLSADWKRILEIQPGHFIPKFLLEKL